MAVLKLNTNAVITTVGLFLIWVPDVLGSSCSTVTTFNAGLATRVKDYWSRRTIVADALASQGSDVLCLQEFWFEDDMRNVIEDLKSIYPYHFSGTHTQLNKLEDDSWSWFARSACSFLELGYLTTFIFPCAISQGCHSILLESIEAGLACLADRCSHVFQSDYVRPDCISCLVVSSSSAGDITNRCHKWFGADNRLNPSGLLVLSKKKLSNPVYEPYFPDNDQTLHRGYIQAQIEDLGTVVCTHYTSLFPHYFEYDLEYESYQHQKLVEINKTVARLGSSDHILAADLNTGIAVNSSDPEKRLTDEAPESYKLLEDAGYDVARYLSDDGRCTYCNANTIVDNYNVAIDDVLVMGNAFTSVVKHRVLDQTNPPLSDHYGVTARLCK